MMTSSLDRSDSSRGDRDRTRAYLREFIPGMVGYMIVLVLVIAFGGLDGTSSWRFVWALLPAVPLVWIVIAVIRHLRRLDEFQQRLLLQGFACGFAVAMGTSVTMGLLEAAGLQSRVTPWIIFGAGMFGWGIASIAAGRR